MAVKQREIAFVASMALSDDSRIALICGKSHVADASSQLAEVKLL